jgi:hypothetical protein
MYIEAWFEAILWHSVDLDDRTPRYGAAASGDQGASPLQEGIFKMKLVYSRVGGASAARLCGEAGAGWLGGADARGLPYRRAWVAYAARLSIDVSDLWTDMAFPAPAPQRRHAQPMAGEEAYILQRDPDGLWFVDAWAEAAGTLRPFSPRMARGSAHMNGARDLGNTCFIIELAHATHP